jgi:hypothetical protein
MGDYLKELQPPQPYFASEMGIPSKPWFGGETFKKIFKFFFGGHYPQLTPNFLQLIPFCFNSRHTGSSIVF